jgi:CRP-like cAMP-binding protein
MTIATNTRTAADVEAGLDAAKSVVKLLAERTGAPVRVTNEDLRQLAAVVTPRRVPARHTLENAEQSPKRVWIVTTGTVRMTLPGRILDVLEGPAIIGDDHVVRHTKLLTSVRSSTPLDVFTIEAQAFSELMSRAPSLAAAWMGEMAAKADHDRRRSNYLLSGDLTAQLAGLLEHRSQGGTVMLTQATLASLLNVHRASVSRALHTLARQGAIEIGYATVRIRDVERLRSIAKG